TSHAFSSPLGQTGGRRSGESGGRGRPPRGEASLSFLVAIRAARMWTTAWPSIAAAGNEKELPTSVTRRAFERLRALLRGSVRPPAGLQGLEWACAYVCATRRGSCHRAILRLWRRTRVRYCTNRRNPARVPQALRCPNSLGGSLRRPLLPS